MNSRHLVSLDLVAALDAFPVITIDAQTLPVLRSFDFPAPPDAPKYPDIEVTERRVPGPPGAPEVRVLVYQSKQVTASKPALLWIHGGGGYVMGTVEGDDLMLKAMVNQLGCAAVSVDYRLAPETPAPGNVEDCYAALAAHIGGAARCGRGAYRHRRSQRGRRVGGGVGPAGP